MSGSDGPNRSLLFHGESRPRKAGFLVFVLSLWIGLALRGLLIVSSL
jgi:hypothetical protein